MDFNELEAMEGLRWTWNSWPTSKSDAEALVIPLSVMCTPLHSVVELPALAHAPLTCFPCGAVLNPYSRVDYQSGVWACSFCGGRNRFPKTYVSGADESSIPAELFPTYSTVEYHLGSSDRAGTGFGPAFVFVVDVCMEEEELRVVKSELLHVIARLPENALVGLVVFDSMVKVYDLGFSEGTRMVVLHGGRDISAEQTKELLGIHHSKQQYGRLSSVKNQSFLLPLSECEFSVTNAIEDLCSSPNTVVGVRPLRSTGVAISVAIGLLEGCSVNLASRAMVFTSGPATIGPGLIVDLEFSHAIRTHQDINGGFAPYYDKSSEFYQQLSQRMSESSIVLDLFACSLDQVGAAEMALTVEGSGGFMMLGETFDSEQFRKSLHQIFSRDEQGNLNMCFDATIELVTSTGVKISGALGPCVSLNKANSSVSNKPVGKGGTHAWKLGTLTNKTCITFFFEVDKKQKIEPNTPFLIQFITQYRYGNMGIRKRVTTVARRWALSRSLDIASGFDQEAAASVIARLAIDRAKRYRTHEVINWLDEMLIRFSAKFGEYVQEDPSTFGLSSNLSLFPQFIYHLRRSQFIVVFNYSPDETAFFRVILNREGVLGSVSMIQPTLFQYSFDGPPIPVLLDVRSIFPDVILLFDSYFHVIIHYGSQTAQWRKLGYHQDPSYESLRKLLEAVQYDAEQLVADRVPVPRLIKCDQHSSQARFLLAKLNPSVTPSSTYSEGSEVIITDDPSMEVFLEHLRSLAVSG